MMQAGTYYIGDLCYVMTDDEWDKFCDLEPDGEREMPDGRKIATYCTQYGDGVYFDQFNNEYGVDAGLIGCIRIEDISPEARSGIQFGAVHEFGTDFVTGGGRGTPGWSGAIQFGRVLIETGSEEQWDVDEPDCDI